MHTLTHGILTFACFATTVAATGASSSSKGGFAIGQFVKFAHGVSSGAVSLLDSKSMLIRKFKYDGLGPAAYFQIGHRAPENGMPMPTRTRSEFEDLDDNPRIPDETSSCALLKAYKGKNIVLTLPGNATWADVAYVAVYCYRFHHNFGYVDIPKGGWEFAGADGVRGEGLDFCRMPIAEREGIFSFLRRHWYTEA